jgi:hypothetical protein
MSLFDDYKALFNSNTGNLKVIHGGGYFIVMKDLVAFKCPLLKADILPIERIEGQYALDWSHFSKPVAEYVFKYLYYRPNLERYTGKQIVELYDLAVKYNLKYDCDDKDVVLSEFMIEKFKWICTDPFEVLELTHERADKKLFNKALENAQQLLRQCMAKQCCFDTLNPGTADRPSDYVNYVCCEHSHPDKFRGLHPLNWHPEGLNKNLSLCSTKLSHNDKTICYSYTVVGSFVPDDCETSLCCRHSKGEIKAQNYLKFTKLSADLKKAVLKGMLPILPEFPTKITVEKPDGSKEDLKTKDTDDDFVEILKDGTS